MKRCASLQERLADEGISLMERDAAVREHVAGCDECGAFVASLRQVDAGLSHLPPLTPPPQVLARTIAAVTGEQIQPSKRSAADPEARRLAASLAAVVVLGAGFALTESVQLELEQMEQFIAQQISVADKLGSYSLSDDSCPPCLCAPLRRINQRCPCRSRWPSRNPWPRQWRRRAGILSRP